MDPENSSAGANASSLHVRPPTQERSRRTLERIVEAARSLMAEGGLDALTVSGIVERADSSVGSFYARFDGKDDLVRYLEERIRVEARQRWDEALASRSWEDLSLEGLVRSVVELLAGLHAEDGNDRAALEGRSDRARPDRFESLHAHVERDVQELLLRRRSEIDHPDPERAAQVAYRWGLGGIRELSLLSVEGDARQPRWDRDEVVEEVTRGLVAYLGPAPGPGGEEKVEFFDVWQ